MTILCSPTTPAPAVRAWDAADARSPNWNRKYIHIACEETVDPDGSEMVRCTVCAQTLFFKSKT